MAVINTTTKQEFHDKVTDSEKVVLVDFWAEWCPPCRAMAPILHELGESMDKDVDIVKVNVEESPDNNKLAAEHGVQGIPNMQIYKGGKVVDELVGMRSRDLLIEELRKHI